MLDVLIFFVLDWVGFLDDIIIGFNISFRYYICLVFYLCGCGFVILVKLLLFNKIKVDFKEEKVRWGFDYNF